MPGLSRHLKTYMLGHFSKMFPWRPKCSHRPTRKCKQLGATIEKEKTVKACRLLFFYCCPQPLAFSVMPTGKCKRQGSTIEKEKTAKAGRLLFFYCRPQGSCILRCAHLKMQAAGGDNRKERQQKLVAFCFYIVAPSLLHFQVGPS